MCSRFGHELLSERSGKPDGELIDLSAPKNAAKDVYAGTRNKPYTKSVELEIDIENGFPPGNCWR